MGCYNWEKKVKYILKISVYQKLIIDYGFTSFILPNHVHHLFFVDSYCCYHHQYPFQISNVGLLGIAINIRYDTVFGNSDIQDILARFSIAEHTLSKALNIFSIVVSTFSSLSIVAIIYSVVAIVSWRWRRIFLYTVCLLVCIYMMGHMPL